MVYDLGDRVLKVAYSSDARRSQHNVWEWEIWQAAEAPVRRWLCPCLEMSEDGRELIQVKARPYTEGLALPDWHSVLPEMTFDEARMPKSPSV